MTSALFSDCTSASSQCRHLEISPIKWSPLSPPLPRPPSSSYSAANRFREWDHRSVGPAGQEGRLQNLLRWGELQFVLPDSASLASFCWSEDWEKSKKKKNHFPWTQLHQGGLVMEGFGGLDWWRPQLALDGLELFSSWDVLDLYTPTLLKTMNWASKLRLDFSQFSSYSELDQTNEKKCTRVNTAPMPPPNLPQTRSETDVNHWHFTQSTLFEFCLPLKKKNKRPSLGLWNRWIHQTDAKDFGRRLIRRVRRPCKEAATWIWRSN